MFRNTVLFGRHESAIAPIPARGMRQRWIGIVLAGLTIVLLAWQVEGVRGEPAPWRVGLARTCVTPEGPIPLCGYNPDLSEGVLDDLFAKAIAFDDGERGRALLVTADLLFFRQPFAEALCERIVARTGLARHQILLNASHTHAGPVFGLRDPDRFELAPPHRAVVDAYTRRLMDQLVDLAVAALADMRPAHLAWGSGQVDFVMNRRVSTEQGVVMSPNPDGEVDPVVPVLRVDHEDGTVRAILFGCACHPVTLDGQNRKISGDYAGAAQRYLEERYPGAQAMFLIGCGGDANSHPRGGPDQEQWVRRHGAALGDEVLRVLSSDLCPVRGPLRPMLEWTDLPLDDTLTREQLGRIAAEGSTAWHRHNGQQLLERLDRGQPLPSAYRAAISVWQFGDDLTLVGLPGEAVAGYVTRLHEALGRERLWIAAYANESFGYLPTARILAEGGHESMCLTLDVGFFAPSVEQVVVDTVRRVARERE
jgi:neutral ceramidase